ncbi:MAG: TonB-dependent receptor [Pseudomonadota bacterium]
MPLLCIAGVALSLGAGHAHSAEPVTELANLSFEELGNIRITSVSKKDERLGDAAASVFVITQDDLRRSGASSLPEALRLAPNLHVAQVSTNGYAISARGFNNSAANKLLVLIDGRSVYTPLFSGVFWDVQNVMLEDVERIEVISGPGGTLWGTNAVNGVINVITRSARDTQGSLATVGAGNRGTNTALRHGGPWGDDGSYRVYGKLSNRTHTATSSMSPVDDASHMAQMGFRIDWAHAGDQLMVQGNAYDGSEQQPAPGSIVTGVNFALGAIALSGLNLLTRWERTLDRGASVSVQAYYDRTQRTVVPTFSESLDIVDVQLQHTLPKMGRHALVWGIGYRYGMDQVINSPFIAFLPANRDQTWSNLFAQDEMTLRDDLRLTIGARIERNDYTGNEFLPSARLAWKVAPDHLLWSAASRTVRAPSRLDRDTFGPGSAPFLLVGGPEVRSEIATVYELGYRGQPTSRLSYSATLFHADYDHLRTQEITLDPLSVFGGNITFANRMEGSTNGLEMWGTYQATPSWRLSGGFTTLGESLTLKPDSNDQAAALNVGKDPAHLWQLRSSLDLSGQSELDVTVRHVAELSNPAVPAYTAVDLRYGWRPHPGLELSVTAQNLGSPGHGEFTDVRTRSTLEPSVWFKLVTRF